MGFDEMFPIFKKRKTKTEIVRKREEQEEQEEQEEYRQESADYAVIVTSERGEMTGHSQSGKHCGPIVKPKEMMTFVPPRDMSCPRFCKVMPEFAHHLSIFLKDYSIELLARNGSLKQSRGESPETPIVVSEISSFGPLENEANKFEILMDANFRNYFVTPLVVFFQDILKLAMIRSGLISIEGDKGAVESMGEKLMKQKQDLMLGVEYHHQAIQFLCTNNEICKQAITCWVEYINGVIQIISAIVKNDYAQKMVDFSETAKNLGHQLDGFDFGNREDVGLYINFDISEVVVPKESQFDTRSSEIEMVGPTPGKFSKTPVNYEIDLGGEPPARPEVMPIACGYGNKTKPIHAKFRPLGPNDYLLADSHPGSDSDDSEHSDHSDSDSDSEGHHHHYGLCSLGEEGFSLNIQSVGLEHITTTNQKTVKTKFDKSYYDTESGRMMQVYSVKDKRVTLSEDDYRLRLKFAGDNGKSVVIHIHIPKDRIKACKHGFELRADSIAKFGLNCGDCGNKLFSDLRFLFSGRTLDKIVFGVSGKCVSTEYIS